MTGVELDLLELGEQAARCLKGENEAQDRDRIVAGRAWRLLRHKLRISSKSRI